MIRQLSQVPQVPNNGFYNQCSGALSLVMPQEAINQIQNPSFELYTDVYGVPFSGWSLTRRSGGVNTTITNISTYIVNGGPVWSGANSVYTANVLGSQFVNLEYANVAVEQASYYVFSFYIYGASGSSGRLYTAQVIDYATVLGQKQFSIIEGQWQRIELAVYTQGSSAFVRLQIAKNPIAGSYVGGDVYIDACQFEKITIDDEVIGIPVSTMRATTYFDGDSTGMIDDSTGVIEFAWQGSPHRSRSVRSGATAAGGKIYNLQDDFGLEIVGIAEAGMNQPQVQTLTYNSQDGGSLQDIINPVRVITLIGQVHGSDKIDLSRKLQRLTALFSRDIIQYRQDRKFIFQHKDGRENIGVPLTFTGTFAGGLNVMATDTLSVNVDIAIQMNDPYFYGHDEGMRLKLPAEANNGIYAISPYDIASTTKMMRTLGAGVNLAVYTIAQAPDGRIWIGGAFNNTSYPYIAIYNPVTNTISAVPGAALNGAVRAIKFSPDGKAWIGGDFTGPNGNYITTHTGTAYQFTANFNAVVQDIQVVPTGSTYEVFAVGGFTTGPAGNMYRIGRYQAIFNSWSTFGTGAGFNAIAYAITYDSQRDILYVGGSFTTTQGGAVSCARVAQIGRLSGTTSTVGTGIGNASVLALYVDIDGTLIIGGNFTSPSNFLAYFANGVVSAWPIGYTPAPRSWVSVNAITKYKDGIFVGAQRAINSTTVASPSYRTNLPSLAYWNGSALTGSAWIPIANCGMDTRYVGLELPDGQLIVGGLDPVGDYSVDLTHTRNNSTVQAYPTIRMQFNDNSPVQVISIINAHDNKTMIFNDRYEENGTATDVELDFAFGDIVTIKPRYSTVKSLKLTNALRVMNPAGSFIDFTIRPGDVALGLMVNALYAELGYNVEVFWPQTFQSIFDGAYKS